MKKILNYTIRILGIFFILINIITAFHAYKFTHFYNASEKPASFTQQKNGWNIAAEIFTGSKAYKQPSSFISDSMPEKVYIRTKDKIKLEGWYMPAGGEAKGTVLLFHGHGSKKSAVLQEASVFKQLGYHTFLLDFRAHGNSEGNTSTIGYYEAEDVKLAYDFIKSRGEKNIILWGISMGAATITKAMNDYTLQPSKIILEMPFASILQAAEGRIKMMGLPPEPLAVLVTFWGGAEHGFWAFDMKPAAFAKNIHVPVLLQWGRQDARVQEGETKLIYSNLSGQKKLVIYENSGHESLCEKEHDKWMKEVSNFLID